MPSFRTSDGVRLDYSDVGQGRPVVLVSGFTAPATMWALQVPALLRAGYRVIGFDRRSHGTSESPAFGQRMSRHGKDLAELLDAAALEGVALVGASMGASTIWAYLDLFGADRIVGYVSVDQTPKMLNTPDWDKGFYGLTEVNVGTFFSRGIPSTGRGLPIETTIERMRALLVELGEPPVMSDATAPETRPLLFDHAVQDWRDVVGRIPAPALLVAGRESQLWPFGHATSSAETNTAVTAVVIDDCGHAVNTDQPERFNEVLVHFLGGL